MIKILKYRLKSTGLTRRLSCFDSNVNAAVNPLVVKLFRNSKDRANCRLPITNSIARFSTKAETKEFQAETRKLLDIVTHNIYTDKEVFLRELISNASDALEKYKYRQNNGEVVANQAPLEIQLFINKESNAITLIDNGIGMTRDELISNLGTIARSGSRNFVQELNGSSDGTAANKEGNEIIGKFGVGFYSSFMVSDRVSVESISALTSNSQEINKWSSDGSGEFTIETIDTDSSSDTTPFIHGSRIIMNLKESCSDFLDAEKVKTIIKKYSSFVSFPIKLNGEIVNTVSALWTQDKKDISKSQYEEFFKFISNAYDGPKYTLHFKTDAPIDLKCLFFIPSMHHEKFGMGRMEPGVNLYSRRVLIESKPKDLLPDWLRFVKGVVDSEDLPLSLSREKPQDSNLLRRMREVLTRKIIRFLDDQSKSDSVTYKEFYLEYNYFLKEGICHDNNFVDSIAKLLRFESSTQGYGELVSFDDYISRCSPDEKNIYYLISTSRDAALESPYYETFKKNNKEVLFLYNTIDDFVMTNIKSYSGRNFVSAENSSIDLGKKEDEISEDKDTKTCLSEDEAKELCAWFSTVLGSSKVREVKTTSRLSDSPAIVTDHQSGALRKMMKMLDQANTGGMKSSVVPPQVFEINPQHPLIVDIFKLRQQPVSSSESVTSSQSNDSSAQSEVEESSRDVPEVAQLIIEQLFDNALIAAGLVDDARSMIPRINEILKATAAKNI